MSEETRHKFNRLHFYTLLLAFLSVSMTFIIFSSVAQATLTCNAVSYITSIGTNSDACGRDIQQFQQGVTSCNIQAPAWACNAQVTFPTAFTLSPNHESAQWAGIDIPGGDHAEQFVPYQTLFIQSDNGETWTNMPAALTEIYGTAGNHRTAITLNQDFTYSVFFGLTCLTASNSANATLRPMYGDPSTGLFHPLSITTTGLDIQVGQNSPCPLSPNAGFDALTSSATNINPAFFTSGSNEVAIFGLSGAGVGDIPKFNNLYLQFQIQIRNSPATCVPRDATKNCSDCGPPANQLTTMTMCATMTYPPIGSFHVQFQWSAYLCVKGGSSC